MIKISAMPENTPDKQHAPLSNAQRIHEAEQSTQNSFAQYKGSAKTETWMWIVGILVVIIVVAAAVFAGVRYLAEPEEQPILDKQLVEVDESAPVETLDGGLVGTFAGEFNAGPDNSWQGAISFAGATAILAYPHSGCQALLQLTPPEQADASADDGSVYTYDTQALNRKCVSDGYWEFEEDSGAVSAQYFEVNNDGETELKAAAQLTRNLDELVASAR